jgi:hypothetical protein
MKSEAPWQLNIMKRFLHGFMGRFSTGKYA